MSSSRNSNGPDRPSVAGPVAASPKQQEEHELEDNFSSAEAGGVAGTPPTGCFQIPQRTFRTEVTALVNCQKFRLQYLSPKDGETNEQRVLRLHEMFKAVQRARFYQEKGHQPMGSNKEKTELLSATPVASGYEARTRRRGHNIIKTDEAARRNCEKFGVDYVPPKEHETPEEREERFLQISRAVNSKRNQLWYEEFGVDYLPPKENETLEERAERLLQMSSRAVNSKRYQVQSHEEMRKQEQQNQVLSVATSEEANNPAQGRSAEETTGAASTHEQRGAKNEEKISQQPKEQKRSATSTAGGSTSCAYSVPSVTPDTRPTGASSSSVPQQHGTIHNANEQQKQSGNDGNNRNGSGNIDNKKRKTRQQGSVGTTSTIATPAAATTAVTNTDSFVPAAPAPAGHDRDPKKTTSRLTPKEPPLVATLSPRCPKGAAVVSGTAATLTTTFAPRSSLYTTSTCSSSTKTSGHGTAEGAHVLQTSWDKQEQPNETLSGTTGASATTATQRDSSRCACNESASDKGRSLGHSSQKRFAEETAGPVAHGQQGPSKKKLKSPQVTPLTSTRATTTCTTPAGMDQV